jgi:hypothetical protein
MMRGGGPTDAGTSGFGGFLHCDGYGSGVCSQLLADVVGRLATQLGP